ncbi:MAG: hypothetical protein IK083_08430 [Abditibacteriota bacterium]|nr:hypothetical protein [Abditibacteriota bacterium]
MNKQKITKGQFFTKAQLWLKPQVKDFIESSDRAVAYDPFAGAGDLINCSDLYGIKNRLGLDIDDSLGWEHNDSLLRVPRIDNSIIITNPPYLSNYSASRKKVMEDVKQYFDASEYDDLYLIALDRLLQSSDYVVAIVPETFINSNYLQKNRLSQITILEENPFEDTETPVCVACFDNAIKPLEDIVIYKNNDLITTLAEIEALRLQPKNNIKIIFNKSDAWLGLRAVDTTNPAKRIKFDYKENFNYDWSKGIKVSSRLLTLININVPDNDRQSFINESNSILEDVRLKTSDIILSPFKGNMKNGVRRRRLDYYTARAILEIAYIKIYGENDVSDQPLLFSTFG